MPYPSADDQAKIPKGGAKVQRLQEADGPEQQAGGCRRPDATPQRAAAHEVMSLATSIGVTGNHIIQGRHARVMFLVLCRVYFSNVPEVQLRSAQRQEHQHEEDAAKQEVHRAERLPQVRPRCRRLLPCSVLVDRH
jgi:hypothetical protein